jgi:hypothetical protein
MRKIHILMLSLVAVFAFSAVTASMASATEFELLCVEDLTSSVKPKFLTETTCLAGTPVNEEGAWFLGFEWLVKGNVVPAAGVTVDITTTDIVLNDMSAGPLKQNTSVLCEGTGLGLLLPGGLDEQNSFNPEKCVRVVDGACSTLLTFEEVNLPWLTELLPVGTTENEAQDMIYAGTGGNPGWAVICETALGTKTDTCTTNQGTTLLSPEGEEINAEFLESAAESEWAECSEASPKLNGLVVGLVLLHALELGVLVPLTIS